MKKPRRKITFDVIYELSDIHGKRCDRCINSFKTYEKAEAYIMKKAQDDMYSLFIRKSYCLEKK
jgi:hypothetical protein